MRLLFLCGLVAISTAFLRAQAPLPAPTTVPNDENARAFPAWFNACRERTEAAKAAGAKIDTVFLGDSLTERWLRPAEGLPLWNRLYADHALNFGVSGDGTEHLLWRMQAIDLSSFAPTIRTVILLIGTNDAPRPPEEIVAGIGAVLARSHALFPQARTFLVGIPHNARADEVTEAANVKLKEMADGKSLVYVDLPGMMTPDRFIKNWQGLGPDRLHLSAEGYRLWSEALKGAMAPTPTP